MGNLSLTVALAEEYRRLFDRSSVRHERLGLVRRTVARIWAEPAMTRYAAVAAELGVPAHVVGILHSLEGGLDFARHLHNGDPLTARTVHVPSGRPATGEPPFSWETSATDALRLKRLHRWSDWSLAGIAYVLERYNGFGYRSYHPDVPSPYLWSFTTAYTAGKYVADGKWSPTAVSRQCGGMALLRVMFDEGRVRPETAEAAVAAS